MLSLDCFLFQPLFNAGDMGYEIFRIPGIVALPGNILLTYCEARKGRSDWSDIDILFRRSLDGGRSWEPPRQLNQRHLEIPPNPISPRRPGSNERTIGSPVMLVENPLPDSASSRVHLVYCFENYLCFHQQSDDQGATWTQPRDITYSFRSIHARYPWRVFATGPGHGIRLSSGRLLFTAWMSTGEGTGAHRPSVVTTLYSDDSGETWHTGEIVVEDSPHCVNPSESAVVEIVPSQSDAPPMVMINIRSESPGNRRLISTSPNGSTGWTRPTFDMALFDPVCCAGLVSNGETLYFTNPDSSSSVAPGGIFWPRRNLTLRTSFDGGKSWPRTDVIDPGLAGYSDLALGHQGTLYCVYEEGGIEENAYAPNRIVFRAWQVDP